MFQCPDMAGKILVLLRIKQGFRKKTFQNSLLFRIFPEIFILKKNSILLAEEKTCPASADNRAEV